MSQIVHGSGDALVAIVAPVEASSPSEHRQGSRRPEVADELLGSLGGWKRCRGEALAEQMVRGSATFGRPELKGVRSLLTYDGDEFLPRDLRELRVESLHAFVFEDGGISVRLLLRIPGGWEHEGAGLRHHFGPDTRDDTCRGLRQALHEALLPVSTAVVGSGPATVTAIPYFHVIYGGATDTDLPGRGALADELRPLIYPFSAAAAASTSPHCDEYVHAGFAFSLLMWRDGDEERLNSFAVLLQVMQHLYHRLSTACDAIERDIAEGTELTMGQLYELDAELQTAYRHLVTPTFSFDHRILVLRDAILEAWRIPDLLERASYLVDTLRLLESRRESKKRDRRARRLNAAIAVLTFLSVVELTDAAFGLVDRWSGRAGSDQAPAAVTGSEGYPEDPDIVVERP